MSSSRTAVPPISRKMKEENGSIVTVVVVDSVCRHCSRSLHVSGDASQQCGPGRRKRRKGGLPPGRAGGGWNVEFGLGLSALIAQLGERQTEDLKVPCSIHGQSTRCSVFWGLYYRKFSLSQPSPGPIECSY